MDTRDWEGGRGRGWEGKGEGRNSWEGRKRERECLSGATQEILDNFNAFASD